MSMRAHHLSFFLLRFYNHSMVGKCASHSLIKYKTYEKRHNHITWKTWWFLPLGLHHYAIDEFNYTTDNNQYKHYCGTNSTIFYKFQTLELIIYYVK